MEGKPKKREEKGRAEEGGKRWAGKVLRLN